MAVPDADLRQRPRSITGGYGLPCPDVLQIGECSTSRCCGGHSVRTTAPTASPADCPRLAVR
jgi:hypothetical protein